MVRTKEVKGYGNEEAVEVGRRMFAEERTDDVKLGKYVEVRVETARALFYLMKAHRVCDQHVLEVLTFPDHYIVRLKAEVF